MTVSHIFSKARCRYPISTLQSLTISPSRSMIRRITPCMAGCEGPTFNNMERLWVAILIRWSDQGLSLVERIIFAQRVSLEFFVHQNAFQVRVAAEADAEHIIHFPF